MDSYFSAEDNLTLSWERDDNMSLSSNRMQSQEIHDYCSKVSNDYLPALKVGKQSKQRRQYTKSTITVQLLKKEKARVL